MMEIPSATLAARSACSVGFSVWAVGLRLGLSSRHDEMQVFFV